MTFSATVEGIWKSLINHVPEEMAAEIIVDIKDTVLDEKVKNLDIATVAEEISGCSKCFKNGYIFQKESSMEHSKPKSISSLGKTQYR